MAYTQSDEISLLLTDYDSVETQPWFENNLQKLVSVSASMATLAFNRIFAKNCNRFFERPQPDNEDDTSTCSTLSYCQALKRALQKGAMFDSRAFILPKEEVVNYFIWRQQDATRNSILMAAQSCFSHKEIQGIKCEALQDKLFTERNIKWNDFKPSEKRGTCIIKTMMQKDNVNRRKWILDEDIPIFTKNKDYIDNLVYGRTPEWKT